MPATMRDLLSLMVERSASDLHITTGSAPRIRVHGRLIALDLDQLTPGDTERLAYSVLRDDQRRVFEKHSELDLSFEIEGLARFRANVYRQRGAVGCAVRMIPAK